LTRPNHRTITLIVEDLRGLVTHAQTSRRFPALETVLSRGRHFRPGPRSPDHFRFSLFGMQTEGELPIAAVTRAADSGEKPDPRQYWLRADPITLWADMARVVITGHGFADLDKSETDEIENTVRSVLRDEGIQLHADHPQRWCIALQEPVGANFVPISEALGMDLAEALQQNPESRHWRRVMNEIEIALHSCPVNIRRRRKGIPVVNSVWFWGGGFIPDSIRAGVFDAVYSDHPVSRGLAAITDCRLYSQDEFGGDTGPGIGPSILIDWSASLEQPQEGLDRLEALVACIQGLLSGRRDRLTLLCGLLAGWEFTTASNRRFWRRRYTLEELCAQRFPP